MRRTYNPNVPDSRTTNCLEVTRRLYRGITDIAKRLDDQKGCALTITDLFTPSGEVLRAKLKDYCERLIFKDPVGHARKTEELLWRKGFYDTVFTAKKLRKGNVWNESEKALLSTHLAVGVGFYHHLILRLQSEYSLDLSGVIDFAYPKEKTTLSNEKAKSIHNKLLSDEVRKCAVRIIHRSLICLGDLARYNLDLDPNWDPMIATRYYKIAVSIDPKIGMPHNQLGTMAGNKNYGIDAVYHYMRCILCAEPFEGAEGNLKRIIAAHSYTGKEKMPFEKCAAKLFSLLQLWDSDSPDPENINHDCQNLLIELEGCLISEKGDNNVTNSIEKEDNIDIYLQNCKNEQVPYLSDDMIFKIVAICLMSIAKLKSKQSSEVQGAVAFTLTIISQLMQVTINRLQEAVMEVSVPNGNERDLDLNLQFLDKDEQKEVLNECSNDQSSVVKSRDDCIDVNDNEEKVFVKKEEKLNGIVEHRITKKSRDKSKNLLTKLRRPRKRLNSSDSDASDVGGIRAGSSSDEMNSEISETEEEDALSECNAISDEALSEDFSDDEKDLISSKSRLNGHVANEKDNTDDGNGNFVTENEDERKIEEPNDSKNVKKDNIDNSVTATTNSSTCDENSGSANALAYVALLKKQNFQPNTILEILEREGSLQAIKISFDWLLGNTEIFRMFAKSSSASLKRIVALLNLVMIDSDNLLSKWDRDSIWSSNKEKLKEFTEIVPLPEDIDMRGLKLFDHAHKKLDWSALRQKKMHRQEETLLRALKLTKFGSYVSSIPDSGVKFDETINLFVTSEVKNLGATENQVKTNGRDIESEQSRGKLMRHMGRLWLKAEVRALESRLRSRLISPYLVPDQEALAKHTPALKRLVYAKKFVVIIPSVVVSALDEMKRTSSKAREATRWLEGQLRKGSRFLRAQRPNERLPLPLIKGPKTKDKEAWLFFQIIECCHYLTQQTKVGLNGDKEPPVVTLLTGFSVEERKSSSFSTDGLAKTAGFAYAYGWNVYYLKVLGVLPEKGEGFIARQRAYIWAFLMTMCVWIPQAASLPIILHDLNMTIDCLSTNLSVFMSVTKIIVLRRQRSVIASMVTSIAQDWLKERTKEEWEAMMVTARISSLNSKISFFISNFSFISLVVSQFCVILGSGKDPDRDPRLAFGFLLESYFPFDTSSLFIFVPLWLSQTFSTLLAVYSYSGPDCYVSTAVLHLCGQLSIIRHSLINLVDKITTREPVQYWRRLRGIVRRHEQLNQQTQLIDKLFSLLLLVQMLICTVTVCFQGYAMFRRTFDLNGEPLPIPVLIFRIFYGVGTIVNLFVYCYVGDRLFDESTSITNDFYATPWYDLAPKEARAFILVSQRSIKPLELRAGKFCTFNMQLFNTIMKNSMGYLSILLAMKQRLIE